MLKNPNPQEHASMSMFASSADYWRAQAEANAKDAERYRWLRDRKPGGLYRIAGLVYSDGDAAFDAAIDAAMAGAPAVG